MSPEDPRHGTEAGCKAHYRSGERPCDPCLDAHRRRNIMRRLYPHKRPSIGSQRRIRALQAIGYGRDRIAKEIGWNDGGAMTHLLRSESLLATTAERISDVYERLSMTVPEGAGPSRARTWARRHGYAPPLAWDDIDDPDELPNLGGIDNEVDTVLIARILAHDASLARVATPAERRAVVAAWPHSLADLERMTGWRADRYVVREDGAA